MGLLYCIVQLNYVFYVGWNNKGAKLASRTPCRWEENSTQVIAKLRVRRALFPRKDDHICSYHYRRPCRHVMLLLEMYYHKIGFIFIVMFQLSV